MGRVFSGSSRLFLCIVALFTVGALARPAWAQTGATASIIGQVTDESKAVLPGVTVTASSLALQVGRVSNVTNANGE